MSQTKAQLIEGLNINTSAPADALVIDSSGRVGIGTSSPASLLNISASSGGDTSGLRITRTDSGGGDWRIWSTATVNGEGAGKLIFANSGNRVAIDGSGKVGIGSMTPQGKLHVKTSSSNGYPLAWDDGQLVVSTGETSTSLGIALSVNSSDNSGSLTCLSPNTSWRELNYRALIHKFFRTNTDESARIDSSGRLLMGVSSTSFTTRALFQGSSSGTGGSIFIARNQATPSDGAALGSIFFGASNHSQAVRIGTARDGGTWTAGSSQPSRIEFATTADGASSPTERMRIDSSGRVGIGTTSPTNASLVIEEVGFQVSCETGTSGDGQLRIGHFNDGAFIGTYGDDSGAADFIRFGTHSGDERMRIASNGNVGINNTDPQSKLDVNGDVRIASGQSILSTSSGGTVQIQGGATFPGGNILLGGGSGNDDIRFRTTGASQTSTERMRLDSSGQLLIGKTTGSYPLEVGGVSNPNIRCDGGSSSGQRGLIFAFNGTNFGSVGQNPQSGELTIRSGESGQTGYFITLETGATERMRIDPSGNVGIGTSSPTTPLSVRSSSNISTYGDVSAQFSDNSTGTLYVQHSSARVQLGSDTVLAFGSGGAATERMRINNSGDILFGCTSAAGDSDVGVKVTDHANNPWLRIVGNESTGTNFFLSGYNTNATNNGFRFYVMFNGGIANHSSNNSNLCDEREKKNIVSLESKWNKVKSWELKKFHYNEDADTDDLRYGVIAQQIEEHCPEVLSDWTKQKAADAVLDDDGNVVTPAVPEVVRKGVKEQQMMWMAIKALQEAQTRIETLETQNTAQQTQIDDLLARVTALEAG
jgi:hypothetical protein